jgi:hypothetical protein
LDADELRDAIRLARNLAHLVPVDGDDALADRRIDDL